jgi:glycosyltransferase involved in cell wall biosynthesis
VLSYDSSKPPWGADEAASSWLAGQPEIKPKLAHFYSGTFTKTIEILKTRGCKVVYTAAAHSIDISREEHQKLGWSFNYPHLNEPALWQKYVRGYLLADMVVCPSKLSADVMKSYGCTNVVIIPHGVKLPEKVVAPPSRFSVAYAGQGGADKGLIYLIQAWTRHNRPDAMLTIAGRGTEQLLGLVRQYGGGNIYLRGWVDNLSDVYNNCSVYVQPSASEGFGIEVLEAAAHGRPVICSDGAGAADVATGTVVPKRDVRALAEAIEYYRLNDSKRFADGMSAREKAKAFTWPIICADYVKLWRGLL